MKTIPSQTFDVVWAKVAQDQYKIDASYYKDRLIDTLWNRAGICAKLLTTGERILLPHGISKGSISCRAGEHVALVLDDGIEAVHQGMALP